jgi:predicted amidophosphoribosyltransferase
MTLRPSGSRCQLMQNRFEQKEDGSWVLVLPPYYAGLFELYFSALLPESGFKDSVAGKRCTFPTLDPSIVNKIRNFLRFFAQAVCISMSKYLRTSFSAEMDFCLALDFNKPNPGKDRTEIGELEYQAKYQEDAGAITQLGSKLASAVRLLPLKGMSRTRLLTFVPASPGTGFHLPARLVKAVSDAVSDSFWGVTDPLVHAKLKAGKASAKNLTIDEKIAQWNRIIRADGITLSRSVKGGTVIVVDDLYQSGTTLWSFAKYLKAKGAAHVVGLVCVKSLRDADNR